MLYIVLSNKKAQLLFINAWLRFFALVSQKDFGVARALYYVCQWIAQQKAYRLYKGLVGFRAEDQQRGFPTHKIKPLQSPTA